MRKLQWIMLSAAIASMSFFTSCDKDDDKKPSTDLTDSTSVVDLSGTYEGKTTITLLGDTTATAVLEKKSDTYTLTLKDFVVKTPFAALEVGDVSFAGIAQANTKLSGNGEETIEVALSPVLSAMVGGLESIPVKVTFSEGTIVGKALEFTLNVDLSAISAIPAAFQQLPVAFVGSKQ
jgi:hypothetical protein